MRSVVLSFLFVAASIFFCLTACDYHQTDILDGNEKSQGAGQGDAPKDGPRSETVPNGHVVQEDRLGKHGDLRVIVEFHPETKKYFMRLLSPIEDEGTFYVMVTYHDPQDIFDRAPRYFHDAPEFRRPKFNTEFYETDIRPNSWCQLEFNFAPRDPKSPGRRLQTDRMYVYFPPIDPTEERFDNPFPD